MPGSPNGPALIWAVLFAGLLATATARPAGADDATVDLAGDGAADLIGPGRRLLAKRTFSGKVLWADSNTPISGATVRMYDNDPIGREKMGETTSSATGAYSISYTVKDWDFCCGGSTRPDPVLEVWIGGRLYFKSQEYGNVGKSLSNMNLKVPRHVVKGKLKWAETCAAASGATATVFDEDDIGDDKMGSGKTNADGTYSIIVPKIDGNEAWDPFGGKPDPYVEFTGPYGKAGRTSTKSDVSATILDFGTSTMWRNDPSAAKAIEKSMDPGLQNYVSVMVYPECNPKRMVVTVKLKFRKATFSPPPNNLVPKIKSLVKQGIQDNWSRVGSRAINVPNYGKYDVHVKVEESENGYSTSMKHATEVKKECERSNNVGAPGILLDLTIWYNEGCAKFGDPVNWQTFADAELADTAGHEWGHTVLQHAVDVLYSWTHKGTSTILQDPSDSAQPWPETGDIDLMKYWKGKAPAGYRDRTIATEQDVKRLIAIAKSKRTNRCGSCPYQAPAPPLPPKSPPPPSPAPVPVPSSPPPSPIIINFSPIILPPISFSPPPSPSPPPPEPVPSPPPPAPTFVPVPIPSTRPSPPPPTGTAPSPPPPARTLPSPPPPSPLPIPR